MEELEKKVKELEKKVNYLEKKEKGRQRRSLFKLIIKVAIIGIICYFLYQGYVKAKKTIMPIVDTYNRMTEQFNKINNDTKKVKENTQEKAEDTESFINDLIEKYTN